MLPGYNTDIQHESSSYHIQTEDNGEANHCVISLIYHGGAILAQKKYDYKHLLSTGDYREELRKLMLKQHRQMIKMLQEGKFETQPTQTGRPNERKETKIPTLDEAIMQFLSDI